ncbi:putative proteasome activator protein [Thermochaetoides thermophila DSM 1495]|uniref:Putative proteasome activator protein n=1 Tax=Chaetomium thermophilum (strain DSM 1495 / CBS 144.50 / IMI 039719) TaxID=759272 RepID=G0SAC4_CHATD|nr:putative proteasome activator protein [Thermochaetoides thermophila DSM 1495]EGS19696.1 putative proteasome activator protein [Thermochaetoides thermophila DSM 1495]
MDEPLERHSAMAGTFSSSTQPAKPFVKAFVHSSEPISRATSPGLACGEHEQEDNKKRYRPRTFDYFRLLPFPVEDESYRDAALNRLLKNLYISIMAEDFAPGALHWTRELTGWLNLKFEMTRELRARLTQLYYHLALAPGLDGNTADRFAKMVITLTRKKHYLKPGEDLTLDWRPLWKEIKALVLPSECGAHQSMRRRSQKHIVKLCLHCNSYFDPRERKAILDEVLPYFSTSAISNAYIVVNILNHILPTTPAPPTEPLSQPADYLPTFFHLWSLMARSKAFDICFIDMFSRMARDYLTCTHVPFTEHGIFTREQSDLVFTAILRLTEIPVGQANSPYTSLDVASGLGMYLEKDRKKHPVSYMVARWIAHSLSPMCLKAESSILSSLEGLLESIDTFFHPSNQGSWTSFLAQLTFYLTDIFVSRWNRENSGELEVPEERKITPELKKRFVMALREVTFMGIFSKGSKVVNYYYSTLQGLAFLEPDLILPGALQRFYPSLQGLVEVHRTTASLCGLQMIANIMSKQKGYRCHITALLALALPGIDANDLGKTQYTLNFIQAVAYSIPFVELAEEEKAGVAIEWVQREMARMEEEGQDVKICYREELTDEDEAEILRSSTAGLGQFVLALLGKVFALLENLPDSSHLRTGSPEDNVINTLPAALTPLFASLSPKLFDMALEKLAEFVSSHVIHQARDAMAWICSAMCKVNPEKTLKVFIPMLIRNIRSEIDDNGAASDRSSGTEILPRDRALVWYVSMLSMCVVHVGDEVLKYKRELFDIAEYMQEKCRGLPTIHVSNYVHHLLLNLTHTYPIDNALYEPDVIARGLDIQDWGAITDPAKLTIRWHRPSHAEIEFAVELFESQASGAARRLEQLMSDDPPVSRKGKNKEWSDELSRSLTAIRLIISGIATLFDPRRASGEVVNGDADPIQKDADGDAMMEEDDDPLAEVADDEELKRQFQYPAGYPLRPNDPLYDRIHKLREDIGEQLSKTHAFLNANQEDDVACFTALYAAYRTWITDVGIERSAHPLERLLRLYKADISPFKISGLRKQYPRPLLIKRADAYQLQRVKYNAAYRKKSKLDERLLMDLAESCTSTYSDVRRVAQGAQDSSLKVLIASRPLVIPVILEKFREALEKNDHDRIKGAMYTLLFTSLIKTVQRDWRYAPDLMRLYIQTAAVDKSSIQNLGSSALYQLIDFGKPFEHLIIFDRELVETIRPSDDDCSAIIQRRHDFIKTRRAQVEEKKASLGLELTKLAKDSHWRIANRCTIFALNMSLRFDRLAPPEFVDLVANGVNDTHPSLRANYLSAFTALFTAIDMRAVYGHDYRNYLLEQDIDENRIEVPVQADDPEAWTQKFLAQFGQYDEPEYFVDSDFPGWLVWGKTFLAWRGKPKPFLAYDEVEDAVRTQIGQIITKQWFAQCFEYLKQEPRDQNSDRFRMQNVILLSHVFDLMYYGKTVATLKDVIELVKEVYGDGSDRNQHRATAEILAALLSGSIDDPKEMRDQVWAFAAPMLLKVIDTDINPENLHYWATCLHVVIDGKDPRRSRELTEKLEAFRLDMNSNAAFKESSKLQLIEFIISDAGWHFRHEKPILEDCLAHIDHPYKAVRESIGRIIATIYRTRYHESFRDVTTLLEKNKAASSLGLAPYQPTEEFAATIRDVFDRLEKWRCERTPGQQTPSSYTSGAKTVLIWLDSMLSSQECIQLVPFFHDPFVDALLHMMDVKEDPELMKLAYHVYRHLPNIPFRAGADGADDAFLQALIRVGKTASSWHQRLRALVNMQVVYFRRLFLMGPRQREMLFDAVGDMLADPQLEVRDCAAATLAGMIRCSPRAIRDPIIYALKERFEKQLKDNPMPKRRRAGPGAPNAASGTETPAEVQRQIVRRHAAVLGLGALVEAFPYATPPPRWMPEVLAHLATRAASDPGVVGKATKGILAEFKKTRQDSWGVDQKYFTSEQLEDLEGVLWKSYFA